MEKDLEPLIKVAAADVAQEFKDHSKGTGKALGESTLIAAKTVRALVAPLRAIVWGADKIEQYFVPEVEKKLEKVPAEKRIAPALNILGPAVEALRFNGEEKILRNLFANLIATSIDSDTAQNAHPMFVETIKQLSPDEARILQYFGKDTISSIAIVHLRLMTSKEGYKRYANNLSLLWEKAVCEHTSLVPEAIDNLCRLGLFQIPPNECLADEEEYKEIEQRADFKELIRSIEKQKSSKVRIERSILHITSLGIQFMIACVIDKN